MAKNADYMAMGYAAMGLLLFGMIAWTYFRYRMLHRENDMIDDFVAEELAERDSVRAAVGATEETDDVNPSAATPGQSGMTSPSSERARTLPET